MNYRRAFFGAVAFCAVLLAALGYAALHRGKLTTLAAAAAQAADPTDPVVARGPEASSASSPAAGAAEPNAQPALGPAQISPARLQEIGVTTAVAEMKDVNDELHVPGNVDIDEQRLAYVQTRFPGWIQNVFANATYQYVSKGQKLFTIYSPDLVSTEQEYLLAKQNQKSFAGDAHGMGMQERGWLVQAAEERLRQFDVPAAEIASLEQTGRVQREIAVESPSSGYITERNALPNAYVQPDTKLYTIADLSTVWVYANVFQSDVGRLKPDDPAEVSVDAYPGRHFSGRIDQILPEVDVTTRTVRVRLIFRNPGVMLKPGMYVNVDIAVPLGRQLMIPASGVLQTGTRAIAFLDRGQGVLEPRDVEVGPQVDDSVVILKGLAAGDRIVSSANFLVDSEAQLQAALGSFTPLPQTGSGGGAGNGAGAAGAMQIELTTEPSPPRKGANTVTAKVTGADGKPVSGAQVTATFFMPAMPVMGMPSMHSGAALKDRGDGNYSGPLQLDSGGTWQVTVVVERGGQTIATKQLSVSATGGME
jgi:Cu(I)/Ag(I) efflux system membrane fusion protein/cobalt-zinc-cadmium efflux system membrane fusion protein